MKLSSEIARDRPEGNRIRRLLLSEYCDFYEKILLESPFAETTRNGRGIRQVTLGLTPNRLIVAADILKGNSDFLCPANLDPSVESFELVSIYPLNYVTLSVFRRRRCKTLKARFVDGRTRYYELGGAHERQHSWTLWREQVSELSRNRNNGSSLSESTAASSSSSSTLYLLSSEFEVDSIEDFEGIDKTGKCICRVWAHYGAGDYLSPNWPNKDLYLGPSFNELGNGQYAPVPIRFAGASFEDAQCELRDCSSVHLAERKACHSWPTCQNFKCQEICNNRASLCNVIFAKDRRCRSCNGDTMFSRYLDIVRDDHTSLKRTTKRSTWKTTERKNAHTGRKSNIGLHQRKSQKKVVAKVSRFGFGVEEKCSSELVLGPYPRDPEYMRSMDRVNMSLDPYKLVEGGVSIWEKAKSRKGSKSCRRHLRRYGLSTAPHFLYALGPWAVQPGERESVQGPRALSAVCLRKHQADPELKLTISRRQLSTTVSCTSLNPKRCKSISAVGRGRVILFWTPDYWYRPRPATSVYRELRQHLAVIGKFRQEKEYHRMDRKLFYRRKRPRDERKAAMEAKGTIGKKSSGLLMRIFSGTSEIGKRSKKSPTKEDGDGSPQLRRLLRMNLRITIWDLDSTTLARQLTIVDRDLFVRITSVETEAVVLQRSTRNAPNFGAWIAFEHRISCLATSEVLSVKKLEMRTRIIARLINAAHKCFVMGNFHSCRSILAGLQAPPVYRLRASWSYLRIHHATRYEIMEKLCKIYKNTRTSVYRKEWAKAERKAPCLPYVGDVLVRILGLNDIFACTCCRGHSSRKAPLHTNNRQKSTTLKHRSALPSNSTSETCREWRQTLGKRMLIATFVKMMCKQHQDVSRDVECPPWTSRRQHLARKYYHLWRENLLKAKLYEENAKRLNNLSPIRRRIFHVTSWLADCQRMSLAYNFPGHPLAWEFLLKARYREDRENFFISLQLEKPTVTTSAGT